MGKRWEGYDNQVIVDYYFTEGSRGCHKRLPHRTIYAVQNQAQKLGIKVIQLWQDQENQILEDWFPISSKECQKRLSCRTLAAIRLQAVKLGIKGNKGQSFQDLTGNIYGIYKVVKRGADYEGPKTGEHSTRWWIKCTKCGTEKFALAAHLPKYNYTSCPNCPKLEIGKIYNKYLEPIERVGDHKDRKSGRYFQRFKMKCHYGAKGCEGEFTVLASSVLRGATNSCGCLRDEIARERMTGSNCPNWKGGITELHDAVRNCDKNLKWKKDCRERDNYTCQKCGKRGDSRFPVHHIKFFTILLGELIVLGITDLKDIPDDSEFWDTDNGITLCVDCHKEVHHIYGKVSCTREEFIEWLKSE